MSPPYAGDSVFINVASDHSRPAAATATVPTVTAPTCTAHSAPLNQSPAGVRAQPALERRAGGAGGGHTPSLQERTSEGTEGLLSAVPEPGASERPGGHGKDSQALEGDKSRTGPQFCQDPADPCVQGPLGLVGQGRAQ